MEERDFNQPENQLTVLGNWCGKFGHGFASHERGPGLYSCSSFGVGSRLMIAAAQGRWTWLGLRRRRCGRGRRPGAPGVLVPTGDFTHGTVIKLVYAHSDWIFMAKNRDDNGAASHNLKREKSRHGTVPSQMKKCWPWELLTPASKGEFTVVQFFIKSRKK